MNLTPMTFLIVCPFVFLAGFIDSIAGGGGLISLPAYLLAGIPIHRTVGTNKFSSACGTTVAVLRFASKGLIPWNLALPGVIMGFIGSAIGANISLLLSEKVLLLILLFVIPVVAFTVLNKKLLKDDIPPAKNFTRRQYVLVMLSALLIGIYDGLYGPGTGTFLIIAFTAVAKINMTQANTVAKVINLATNFAALSVFLLNGQVWILLGLAAAGFNMVGQYIGSGMVMKKGSAVVRPIMMVVIVILFVKVLTELL